MEILSPSDRFALLNEKCRKYAEWAVADILLFDPVERCAWRWDRAAQNLVRFESHVFSSQPGVKLSLEEIFRRFEEEI